MGSLAEQLTRRMRNSGASLAPGSLVTATSTNNEAAAALASTALSVAGAIQAQQNVPTGGSMNVVTSGLASVLLETGLSPAAGNILWVSDSTAGRGTTTQPSTPVAVGFVIDASTYAKTGRVLAIVSSVAAAAAASSGIAGWDPDLVRYFFVDNESGDDGNLGYIDAAAGSTFTTTQTAAVALKTLEELRDRLPRVGAGRSAVILCKTRTAGGQTYLNKAGAADFLDIRTVNYDYIAWKASNDLSNDANDQVDLGGIDAATGPNADGSWTVDSRSGFAVTVAAGALPAEDDLAGLKLEFKGNVTASIRTRGNVVSGRNSGTVFELGSNFGAGFVPEAGDEFFFRRPGIIVADLVGAPIQASDAGFSSPGSVVTGFEVTNTTLKVFISPTDLPFMRWAGTVNFQGFYRIGGTSYTTEAGTFPFTSIGSDFRTTGNVVLSGAGWGLPGTGAFEIRYSAFHDTGTSAPVILNIGPRALLGGGCYMNSRPLFEFASGGRRSSSGEGGVLLGRESSVINYLRGIGGIELRGFKGTVRGFTPTTGVATNAVLLTGEGNEVSLVDCIGTSTGAYLSVSGCDQSKVYVGAGVTGTGTPDIALAGSVTKTFASLASDHWVDGRDNFIQGAGGRVVRRITDGTIANVPVRTTAPGTPVDGDIWIQDTGGTRTFNARIGGVTYSATLT